MNIVAAETDKTCALCGAPATTCDLDAVEGEPAFFCPTHEPPQETMAISSPRVFQAAYADQGRRCTITEISAAVPRRVIADLHGTENEVAALAAVVHDWLAREGWSWREATHGAL